MKKYINDRYIVLRGLPQLVLTLMDSPKFSPILEWHVWQFFGKRENNISILIPLVQQNRAIKEKAAKLVW